MLIGKSGQVSHEEEIKEQLNVRSLFIVCKLGVLKQRLIVRIKLRLVVLRRIVPTILLCFQQLRQIDVSRS